MTATETKPLFADSEVVYEFEDGWKAVYVNNLPDLQMLGRVMHHCAGQQKVWALEEKIWYFFTLIDPQGKPHGTIHMKQATWMGKRHPRDGQPGTGPIARCNAYDYGAQGGDYQDTFEARYGCRLPNRGNRPPGVDEDVWNTYVKAHKGLCDNWRKNVGALKIEGRRVKFDGKYLIVLSAYGSYQSEGDVYRKRVGELLASMGKKKGA